MIIYQINHYFIMDRKYLVIAGSLIGIIVLISVGMFIFLNLTSTDSSTATTQVNGVFNSKSPEEKAVFIARLNDGSFGFESGTVDNAYLTSDGKYWIVTLTQMGDYGGIVTVDAKTWMSKKEDGEWRSFDELKAQYIADIQKDRTNGVVDPPIKVTMDSKEIWKVPVYKFNYEHNEWEEAEYVYVDAATGKSKNTWDEFNRVAGTDGWLTLKQVDDTINKIGYPGALPFRDALRDLYSE